MIFSKPRTEGKIFFLHSAKFQAACVITEKSLHIEKGYIRGQVRGRLLQALYYVTFLDKYYLEVLKIQFNFPLKS